jgi:hypothetical protein
MEEKKSDNDVLDEYQYVKDNFYVPLLKVQSEINDVEAKMLKYIRDKRKDEDLSSKETTSSLLLAFEDLVKSTEALQNSFKIFSNVLKNMVK